MLEPIGGNLARTILLQSSPISDFGDQQLLAVLRHELGHVMGFVHEEVNHPGSVGGGCSDVDPRPLTPVDSPSIMSTPGCTGLSDDAMHLTHFDRLSAFYLQHTPRSRFETRSASAGYRYSGVVGDGAEILWHAQGATEGVLWRPQIGPDGITFVSEPFPYSSLQPPPAGGWFPNESEIVIPLQLANGSEQIDVMMFGPGPDVLDLAVFNSGVDTSAALWSHDSFSVPVIGRFDGQELDRDVVYLYRSGPADDVAVAGLSGTIVETSSPPQQSGFAYPLAAPYRGAGHPDDIIWLEPHEGRVTAWRLEDESFALAHASRRPQAEFGLVPGENIPVVGDFNGDDRADIMWQGVSNLPAGFRDIEDVLWLSASTATELVFSTIPKSVGYSFRPLVGDFDGHRG